MNVKKFPSYIKKLVSNPWILWPYLGGRGLLNWFPDSIYLKGCFRAYMGYRLDLKNPQTFNEKIQWLKLHDRKPEYTQMVDKYAVREYIAKTIGEEYLIPLLGVWDRFDEIDFDQLPDQFVLKCNHDSGTVVICKDKKTFDIDDARKKINAGLTRNFYYSAREWPYKNVKPKIIAEKYMVDESGTELKDYKVFNFNGTPKLIQVDFGRFTEHKRNLYTLNWEYLNLSILYPTAPDIHIEKPRVLSELLSLSSQLSRNIPLLRTDFYIINEKIYLGELTFHHGAGYEPFYPQDWNKIMGSWIELSNEMEIE